MTATQSTTTPAPVHPGDRPAIRCVRFWRSAIGKKWVMAVTGIMLLGFVLAHMIGNLKIYLGAEPHRPLRRVAPHPRRAGAAPHGAAVDHAGRAHRAPSSSTSSPPPSSRA